VRPSPASTPTIGISAATSSWRGTAGLSLAEVYRQQEEIHRRVIDAVVRTPDAQLARETRYRRLLRLDTYNHYPKHTEAIRWWRAQRQASGTGVPTAAVRRQPLARATT
jgi:hypothetical protein